MDVLGKDVLEKAVVVEVEFECTPVVNNLITQSKKKILIIKNRNYSTNLLF
jgi:hypothetical protein